MPKPTQRDVARASLESLGFVYSAGGGDHWTMVAPCETFALLLGRAGSCRSSKRTPRGFPKTGSFNICLPGESPDAAIRRIFARRFAKLESAI